MARTNTNPLKRKEIPYFDGINTLVADNLSKSNEFNYIENARSRRIGIIEKREGTTRLGNSITATNNYGIFFFENDVSTVDGMYRISTVSGSTKIYYLNNSANWIALTGTVTGSKFSGTIAENNLFLVNGSNNNMYVSGVDGTTVVTSASTSGHLYQSPKAKKINYYKERLYVSDYTNAAGVRYRNGIMMSSTTLGVLSLVDGDNAAGVTTIEVTDTKYIRTTDSLDVYRGGTLIETLTVSAKTETTITVNATGNAINSSDELWVASTYSGTRLFRWADYPDVGIDIKQYDTFKIAGGQNDRIRMMENIGDIMIISNSRNMALWNGSALRNLDNGIGCVSDNGYVKAFDSLFFIGYKGIYQTAGGAPELISPKVQSYIDGATKTGLEAASMGVKGNSIFCHIGTVTLHNDDGSLNGTVTNVVLEKDIRTQNWYVHSGIKATEFETYVASSNADKLIFSSTETGYHLYEFLSGSLDDTDNGDNEILFRIDTGNITLSKEFEKFVYPQKIIIEVERGSSMTAFVSLDNGNFYELQGKVIKGVSVINITGKNGDTSSPPRCRNLNISIRDYSKQMCKISKIAIIYSLTNEEVQEQLT